MIEDTLHRMATALEKIAALLEAKAESKAESKAEPKEDKGRRNPVVLSMGRLLYAPLASDQPPALSRI